MSARGYVCASPLLFNKDQGIARHFSSFTTTRLEAGPFLKAYQP